MVFLKSENSGPDKENNELHGSKVRKTHPLHNLQTPRLHLRVWIRHHYYGKWLMKTVPAQ